jgi:thymidylate kinase
LEGLPGGGKTTCFHRFIAAYANSDVLFLPEANPPPWIDGLTPSLSGWLGSRYFQLIWEGRLAAMRWLRAAGHALLLDRSFFSNLAYLHAAKSSLYTVALDRFAKLYSLENAPNLLIVIDLPAELALERRQRLEKLPVPWCLPDFIDRLRRFYRKILPTLLPCQIYFVPGELPPDALWQAVLSLAGPVLPTPKQRSIPPVPPHGMTLLDNAARTWRLGKSSAPTIWQLGRPAKFFQRQAIWHSQTRGVERIPWHRPSLLK